MIISKEYGPQLDAIDGTCGDIKLVRRWVLWSKSGGIFGSSQGRYTYATKPAAEQALASVIRSNPLDRYPKDLTTKAYWCWPGHYDPAISCDL